MLTHRGFSAWISTNEEPLTEYLVAVNSKTESVSCWIPSEPGKAFTVSWRDHGGKVDTCAFITLDGFTVPGRFLFGEGVAWRNGVRTGKATERPFVFPKDVSTSTNAKDIGTITLKIKRVDRVIGRPANLPQPLPGKALGKRRAGDICVGFGEERKAFEQYGYTWSVKSHEDSSMKPKTYVTFIFRYRSPEFLQAQGIMTEEDTSTVTKTGRRIVSAPSVPTPEPAPLALTTPRPTPSPERNSRKPRLTDNQLRRPTAAPNRVASRALRPSAEMRRSDSWRSNAFSDDGFLDDLPEDHDGSQDTGFEYDMFLNGR
ncbi:hypothetical protein C8J56DRAFT_959243 [Mycena floridula]|nr:hypothetical protein C8J56DRAFT_959243 [Mycena floridula]